ncbi:MAG TPA: hydrogenase formation protein HypD [Anaerolineae bacterium]|nr:hydrogenase formation protein HypD [Anaerolineae bacterium]
MKYVDEYRDPALARKLLDSIARLADRPMAFMEFCGGHTHAIMQHGIRQLLPSTVRLMSGPGCPVCVTSQTDIDRAIALARMPGAIIATFGDMVRVPGSEYSLQEAAAQGADVRIVYSPLDAVQLAQALPNRQFIFLGIGFETTAPGVAASILQAETLGLTNYTVFSMHKLTPPAMRGILDAGEVRLDGVIGPGHVTTIIGSNAWRFLPDEYGMPIVVSGFEPVDILLTVERLARQVVEGRAEVGNSYSRSVHSEGNQAALRVMWQVFQLSDADWRGFGILPGSGMAIRERYARFDASRRFPVTVGSSREPPGCYCGEVLRGVMEPLDCPLFAKGCTPERPIGPCMVSSEGACAAYFLYGRFERVTLEPEVA